MVSEVSVFLFWLKRKLPGNNHMWQYLTGSFCLSMIFIALNGIWIILPTAMAICFGNLLTTSSVTFQTCKLLRLRVLQLLEAEKIFWHHVSSRIISEGERKKKKKTRNTVLSPSLATSGIYVIGVHWALWKHRALSFASTYRHKMIQTLKKINKWKCESLCCQMLLFILISMEVLN